MGSYTIRVSIDNGILYYQDPQHPVKQTCITSHIEPGTTVYWEALNGSGISEITGIKVLQATKGYLASNPKPESQTKWFVQIGDLSEGHASYQLNHLPEALGFKQNSTSRLAQEGITIINPPDLKTP